MRRDDDGGCRAQAEALLVHLMPKLSLCNKAQARAVLLDEFAAFGADAAEQGARREREECAEIADGCFCTHLHPESPSSEEPLVCEAIAMAIRRRSERAPEGGE